MNRSLINVVLTLGLACGAAAAAAQDLGVKAPPQARAVVIENATVHPVSGPVLEKGHVVFSGGRISAVGSGPAPPSAAAAALRVDASGKHVYPGLIGANTITGLIEVGAVRATLDFSEVGSISPEVRAAVAVNPDSTIIPVTRRNGVLTTAVMPLGGVIPGRASVIRMDGWTWEDLAVKADAGLLVNWPNMRPMSGWWVTTPAEEQQRQQQRELSAIDEAFRTAGAYAGARAAEPATPADLRWEAMRPAIEGRARVFIRANELEQIQSAVAFAVQHKLSAVILGGRDADRCADLLKRHNVGVIVAGTFRLPRRADSDFDEAFVLPQRLEAAGVKWCLATVGGSFETPHERNLPYHAALASAYGLPRDAALRSITLSAAELLGVADTLGSLDAGKAATLILTDGDPLEVTTRVERAWIDGREISLQDKQTELAEKYRERYRQMGLWPTPPGSAAPAGGPGTGAAPAGPTGGSGPAR
ncbi:MAG: amidohydrolase family protein [Phycisphaerales bacterium]|nr:amidohydrolase family protein [Phycisphaerales bacterium]